MYIFDESSLRKELTNLPDRMRVAFAAAAATRQLRNSERMLRELDAKLEQCPRQIAIQLWNDIQSGTLDSAIWSARLDEVMGLLPDESDEWKVIHALADDALSSLAYAIRCFLAPEPQESAWAARRAYEAVDQAAIRALALQPNGPQTESAILSHAFVQRELQRQRNDLDMLQAGLVAEVRRQAFENEILTETEISAVL